MASSLHNIHCRAQVDLQVCQVGDALGERDSVGQAFWPDQYTASADELSPFDCLNLALLIPRLTITITSPGDPSQVGEGFQSTLAAIEAAQRACQFAFGVRDPAIEWVRVQPHTTQRRRRSLCSQGNKVTGGR